MTDEHPALDRMALVADLYGVDPAVLSAEAMFSAPKRVGLPMPGERMTHAGRDWGSPGDWHVQR